MSSPCSRGLINSGHQYCAHSCTAHGITGDWHREAGRRFTDCWRMRGYTRLEDHHTMAGYCHEVVMPVAVVLRTGSSAWLVTSDT